MGKRKNKRSDAEIKASKDIIKKYIKENYHEQLVAELGEFEYYPFSHFHNNNIQHDPKDLLDELYYIKIKQDGFLYKVFIKSKVDEYMNNGIAEYLEEQQNDFLNELHKRTDNKFKIVIEDTQSIKDLVWNNIKFSKHKWMQKFIKETNSFVVVEDTNNLPQVTPENINDYTEQLFDIIRSVSKDIITPNFNLYEIRIRRDGTLVWNHSLDYNITSWNLNFLYLPDDARAKHVEYIYQINESYMSMNHMVQCEESLKDLRGSNLRETFGLIGCQQVILNKPNISSMKDIFSI